GGGGGAVGGAVEVPREGGPQPAGPRPDRGGPASAPNDVVEALAVGGHERIQVHQVADPVGDVLERPGDHQPAVGEPQQHDAPQVLIQHRVRDVGDVRGQADLRAGQVRPLTDAGQAGGEDLVPEIGRAHV